MEKKNSGGKPGTATFAAGCFWGVESVFMKARGVKETSAGYTGGGFEKPTYEDVCSDETGHAEAVQIKFNPKEVSYEKLLAVFFNNHNPTTMNRQGPDVGTRYRSAIFYHDEEQKKAAKKFIEKLEKEKRFSKPIVTQIMKAQEFFKAEKCHQKYYRKKGIEPTCHI